MHVQKPMENTFKHTRAFLLDRAHRKWKASASNTWQLIGKKKMLLIKVEMFILKSLTKNPRPREEGNKVMHASPRPLRRRYLQPTTFILSVKHHTRQNLSAGPRGTTARRRSASQKPTHTSPQTPTPPTTLPLPTLPPKSQ